MIQLQLVAPVGRRSLKLTVVPQESLRRRRLSSRDVLDQGQGAVQAVGGALERPEQHEVALLSEEDLESSAVICAQHILLWGRC